MIIMKTLIYLLNTAYNIILILLIFRAVISWIRPNIRNHNWNKLLKIIYDLTEPLLSPVRKFLPVRRLGFDPSPIILIIVLTIVLRFLTGLLYNIHLDFGI